MDRAREHARESWQREGTDDAIRDVRVYHSSLMDEPSAESAMAGPDDVQGDHDQVDLPPLFVAVR